MLRSIFRFMTPAFLALLVVMGSIELLIRFTMVDFFSGRYQYGFDQTSGFVESPDGAIRFVRAGGRRFYEQSLPRAKSAATFRIITVGDSIARGASLDEAYPAILAEKMRARGFRVESINLAVPGFGARRQQIVLRRALQYSPDLVIFHFGMSNEFEDERDWNRAQQSEHKHPRDWPLRSYLIARLHEYKSEQITPKFLPEKIRLMSALSDAEDEASANRDPARVAAWRAAFAGTFRESLQLLRAANTPVLLVPRVQVFGAAHAISFDDSGLRQLLTTELSQNAYWLDPAQLFGQHPALELFAKDRVHWHPPAHRIAAGAMADLLSGGPGAALAADAAGLGLAVALSNAKSQ
jgi:GDSL-like Lipase/Acylhydrolase family